MLKQRRVWTMVYVYAVKRTSAKDISDETSVRRTSRVCRAHCSNNNGYFQVIDVSSKVEEFNLQRAAPLTRECSRYINVAYPDQKVFSSSAMIMQISTSYNFLFFNAQLSVIDKNSLRIYYSEKALCSYFSRIICL